MQYIRIVPKMRFIGLDESKNQVWVSTVDIVKLIIKSSKLFNTGINVITAQKIFDVCEKVIGENKDIKANGTTIKAKFKTKYIGLEDAWYELIRKEFDSFNFLECGLVGRAFAEDVENIVNPVKDNSDDGELEFEYLRA